MKFRSHSTWLIFFLFISYFSYSQATVTIGDSVSYPCQNIDFPVVAAGFPSDVGAISLYIEIDTNHISYLGNTIGTLSSAFIGYDPSTARIIVSFSSVAGINPDGVMFTLHMSYQNGYSELDFTENICEFVKVNFDPIAVTYSYGSAGPMPRDNYYVDAAAGPGGDGLSWGTAFQTITAATNATLGRGDHVTIRPGTYNEAIVIKSNGLELVPPATGVSVTGPNTVVFPSGTDLDCIDPSSYPDEIFLYLYRSFKGNNGVFEVLSIDNATKTVTVSGPNLTSESGAAGDTTKLHASIAHAIVYRKDTVNPNPVIVSASGISGAKAVCYVGDPIGAGDDANPANYNILDGLRLTGIGSLATGRYGLRIQGSRHNVFMNGSIYECDSVAVLISGNTSHPAKRNIIKGNSIYNTKQKGVKLGREGLTATNNRVHQNVILGNEFYSSGGGGNVNFYTAAETQQYTSHNIFERNTFRNFSFKTGNRGALQIGSNSASNLVIGNYFRDITDALSVTNAFVYIRDNAPNTVVFNNILMMSSATDDNIFAFRFNSLGHTGSRAAFNTIYNVDKGVLFEDPGLPVPGFQFKNNILYQINDFYFTHSGGNVGRFSVSNNCYGVVPTQSGGSAYWPDATSVTGNPQFMDPSFFGSPVGFSLQAGSVCLGAGTPLTGLTVDYLYDSRNATTPAIGAFETVITETIWTGAVSNDWHDWRNWGPEIVPGISLDVIIPVKNLHPNVINSNASCKSIEIQPGAEVIVNSPWSLTIVN